MNKDIMTCYKGGKAKVGGDYDWVGPVIMLAALGGAGYFLYTFISKASPTSGTAANNAAVNTNSAATAASSLAAAQAAGVAQTIDDTTLNGYATTLTNLLIQSNQGWPLPADAQAQVQNVVLNVNTSADWFRLVQLFGTKSYNAGSSYSLCGMFGIACQTADLPSLIRLAVAPAVLSTINSFFADTFSDQSVSI